MKRSLSFLCTVVLTVFLLCGVCGVKVIATETTGTDTKEATFPTDDTILEGICIGEVMVGGLTKDEANNAILAYFGELNDKTFVLCVEDAAGSAEKTVKLSEFFVGWANPEVVDEVVGLAHKGNVIRRYKVRKDNEKSPAEFEIKLNVDRDGLLESLKRNMAEFETASVNAGIYLPDKNADFIITDASLGRMFMYDDIVASLVDYIENEWDFSDGQSFQVLTQITEPMYTEEDLKLIGRKAMGSFSTTFKSSSNERCANIENAASKINGTVIYPGDEFSTLGHITPFTEENGYFEAHSYYDGKLVDSVGGGVCQVATTLYNAVLQAELEVTKRKNHGLTVEYVQLSADAAVAESSGLDFCFNNNTQAPVLLSAYVENKALIIDIYGYDTRPEGRTIKYVHEILDEYEPGEDVYEDDPELPEGTTKVKQAAHKGYKAVLYKNVYMNGSLTEHIKVNESEYKAAPKYISVGTKKTED